MDVKQYLYDNDFYIGVRALDDGNIISVTFPENNLYGVKNPKINREYRFVSDGVLVIENTIEKLITCEEYASRVVVWAHILRTCIIKLYNPEAMLVIKPDNVLSGPTELVAVMRKPSNAKRETELVKIFLNFVNNHQENVLLGEEEAKKVGLGKSFKTITKILKGEK